jgi:hypothetical protein
LNLELRFFEHAGEEPLADLKALPSDQLRKVALWWLKRVRRNVSLGKELGYQVSTGDLAGLYKLYFDEEDQPWDPLWEPPDRRPGDPRPRYRVVYQLLPNADRPEVVEVVSIGPKPFVYRAAAERSERE